MASLPVGKLLCVGLRGARPGDAALEADLAACREAGVGAVILFDVDVPALRRLRDEGVDPEAATLQAARNVIDAGQLRELVAHLRSRLGADLFVGIDQEGGRVARLSPRRGFAPDPSAREFARLGAGERRETARRQARRLRELGIDLNFAPCVDLALEAANEIVVGSGRCFGSEADEVVDAARVVLEEHRAAGVAACLKHFPGHGSSRGDTHLGLVDITASWQREAELEPYRRLAGEEGVAVMVAHVVHRELDADRPASMSPRVVDGLLRGELGFSGVVVTDSIDMRAISAEHAPGTAAVAAVQAGVDLVIDGFNLDARDAHPAPALAAALREALAEGRLSPARIEESLARLQRLRAQIGPAA